MQNNIAEVDEIRNYIRRGYPEGIEPLFRKIGVLFQRIQDLEAVIQTALNANDTAQQYHATALMREVMNPAASRRTSTEMLEAYLPAE